MITEMVGAPDGEGGKSPETLKEKLHYLFVAHLLDWLYFLLFIFTHFYFLAIAFLFFANRGGYFFLSTQLLHALSEPYLGGLGVYVLLKEIRKRKMPSAGRHRGEVFVLAWQALLVVSLGFILFLPTYHFDLIAQLIVANALAVLVIFVASRIHKP